MKDARDDIIKVMLVDDMRGARTGFMMMLNNDPNIIVSSQAADGAQAIEFLRQSPQQLPDVILMDVRMPVMDGIEATGIIKEQFSQIQILILTTYDEDDYAFDGLARGASGFLLKDATPKQLRDAVHAVYNGDAVLTPKSPVKCSIAGFGPYRTTPASSCCEAYSTDFPSGNMKSRNSWRQACPIRKSPNTCSSKRHRYDAR